ncbi:MAG: corrinoid protein [Candidatus Lokiarchaeota archaeon]|nr:corrinoid protein [Candidatus Lokiarchaeota archaeon]
MSLKEMVADGDLYTIEDFVIKALETRKPLDITDELIAGLQLAGDRFQKEEYFVIDMLQAAETFKEAMKVLKPKLGERKTDYIGKFLIGTVKGDIHDIGKNLVSIMLEGARFEVIDLGIDVSADQFIEAIKKYEPQIVGLSALLTTTMLEMEEIIKAIGEANLRDKVKIMVGGAPVSERYASSIGADSYSNNASEAIENAIGLIK